MASIEVSLSTTPRRKKNGSIGSSGGGVVTAGSGSVPTLHRISAPKDNSKELEALRNALRDKENMIQR